MKYIDCPVLGRRPHTEFAISGVLEFEPEAITTGSVGAWAFNRESLPSPRTEWWYHTPTQLWFTVVRHTGSDEILAVELARALDSI